MSVNNYDRTMLSIGKLFIILDALNNNSVQSMEMWSVVSGYGVSTINKASFQLLKKGYVTRELRRKDIRGYNNYKYVITEKGKDVLLKLEPILEQLYRIELDENLSGVFNAE